MRPSGALLSALLTLAGCASHPETSPQPVVTVVVAKAEVADVKATVQAPAFVFARQQTNISARLTAPIQKLFAGKGDRVEAGQVLAQLDNRDLLAQRDEAEAAVAEAEANLERVTAGTLPTDIERARGLVVTTEAALQQAQKIYDRRRQLFQEGAIPQRELLISETELAQAKANYEVARRSLDLLENQSREKDIRIAKSKLEQARAHLKAIRALLDFTTIRSPWAGVITEQFMFPGDMARPDAPIFTMMDLAGVVARAQVPDAEARRIHAGEPCAFQPADAPGATFPGRISVVNPSLDTARRTVESWCEIAGANGTIRPGIFGKVSIVREVMPNSVVVPISAVQFSEDTGRGVVMVAAPEGVAVRREVETGEIFDGKVQIKKGVLPGEPVIVQGAYGLPAGTPIRVAPLADKP